MEDVHIKTLKKEILLKNIELSLIFLISNILRSETMKVAGVIEIYDRLCNTQKWRTVNMCNKAAQCVLFKVIS